MDDTKLFNSVILTLGVTVLIDIMSDMIGNKLLKVYGTFYISRTLELDNNPMEIWLYFEGNHTIHFFGHSDGQRLNVDTSEPDVFDMGDDGEVCLRDYAEKSTFQGLSQKSLKQVWKIKDKFGAIIGFKFDFGEPQKPVILNWGDELYINNDYPDDCEEVEEILI